jgi:hypothetical protein
LNHDCAELETGERRSRQIPLSREQVPSIVEAFRIFAGEHACRSCPPLVAGEETVRSAELKFIKKGRKRKGGVKDDRRMFANDE